MIPPALSAVAFHTLDLGRHVGEPQPKIVAAAVFSSRVEGDTVFFTLDAVTSPADISSRINAHHAIRSRAVQPHQEGHPP